MYRIAMFTMGTRGDGQNPVDSQVNQRSTELN